MEKKLNLLIAFLAIATGYLFYFTWSSNSEINRNTSVDIQENNHSNDLANKVSIPKRETKKSDVSNIKKHSVEFHLTKDNSSKKLIEENNISSNSFQKEQKLIAQTYSNLEPATYVEDIQTAEENFEELDVESRDIKQELQEEMAEIEQ